MHQRQHETPLYDSAPRDGNGFHIQEATPIDNPTPRDTTRFFSKEESSITGPEIPNMSDLDVKEDTSSSPEIFGFHDTFNQSFDESSMRAMNRFYGQEIPSIIDSLTRTTTGMCTSHDSWDIPDPTGFSLFKQTPVDDSNQPASVEYYGLSHAPNSETMMEDQKWTNSTPSDYTFTKDPPTPIIEDGNCPPDDAVTSNSEI